MSENKNGFYITNKHTKFDGAYRIGVNINGLQHIGTRFIAELLGMPFKQYKKLAILHKAKTFAIKIEFLSEDDAQRFANFLNNKYLPTLKFNKKTE